MVLRESLSLSGGRGRLVLLRLVLLQDVYKRQVLPFTGFTANRDGKRFCNEYGSLGTLPFTEQMGCPGGTAYAIWDMNYAEQYPLDWINGSVPYGQPNTLTPEDVVASWEEGVSSGMYVKADTLEDLVKQLGLSLIHI